MDYQFSYQESEVSAQKDRIRAALSEKKSELVIKNVNYLNVFSCEFECADVAIEQGRIVGIGSYQGIQEVDGTDKYIVPGFIDGHMHLESSSVYPMEYAKAVIPHGTTAVVADPHEITNVCGMYGFEYMYRATETNDLDFFFMLPSCVPATQFDESGADFTIEDMREVLQKCNKRVLGLAEVMDYPGVLAGEQKVLHKISMTQMNRGKVDGHAPGLTGKQLNAYNTAGIYTDHECSSMTEALEKHRNGEWIMVREGTAAHNLEQLIPIFEDKYFRRVLLVTDDRHPGDLITEGHIDYIIRRAIELGAKPENVYTCASLHAAQCFDLQQRGAISPGYLADFVLLDDYKKVNIEAVYKNGKCVYSHSDMVESVEKRSTVVENVQKQEALHMKVYDTMHMKTVTADDFVYDSPKKVIGIISKELITTDQGEADAIDFNKDIIKLCVVERHKNTGNIGKAYVTGYGLKEGAIATTVAHDSHNVIVAGVSEEDMACAVMKLKEMGGGMVVVHNQKVLGQLAFPIAGLMSDKSVEYVAEQMDHLKVICRKLGIAEGVDPFMTLSFLSLPVIPKLKVVTRGVVDVEKFELL